MTDQEQFNELHKAAMEAELQFLKKDKEISEINGFIEDQEMIDYATLKHNWQTAMNNYWTFLNIHRLKFNVG